MAFPVTEVTVCQLCGSGNLALVLDMGMQPLSERHDSDRLYPLRLLECGGCTLVQLDHIVDQREVFPPGHPYATGNTGLLREHFAVLAAGLCEDLEPGDLVVDIGAGDGTLINAYRAVRDDLRRVAVEPTEQGWKCHADDTWFGYFTSELADEIFAIHGPARIVTACNVLAHVPDPHDFLEGVRSLLADDGVFVSENHDVLSVVDGLQLDTIYHEHARYFSVTTLSRLLAMHDLAVTRAEPIPTHGGSFRAYAAKPQGNFAIRARIALTDIRRLLADLTGQGALVYGVGATTRATPLIHAAGIARYISCVCEVPSSAKVGLLMPGTSIPVVPEVALVKDRPEYALLFAWHIADSLIPKLRAMGYNGRFVIPLPEPRVIDA